MKTEGDRFSRRRQFRRGRSLLPRERSTPTRPTLGALSAARLRAARRGSPRRRDRDAREGARRSTRRPSTATILLAPAATAAGPCPRRRSSRGDRRPLPTSSTPTCGCVRFRSSRARLRRPRDDHARASGRNMPDAVPLANLHLQAADFVAADASYGRALELQRDWPEALYNRALAAGGAGRPEDASHHLSVHSACGPTIRRRRSRVGNSPARRTARSGDRRLRPRPWR